MAYLLRCRTCNYQATYLTRNEAADAALQHRDETRHAGIEIEDPLSPEGRADGGGEDAE